MPFDVLCDVLSPRMARRLWTAGYPAVLPLTPLHFYMGAVLPAVLYEMRWGHRRGSGRFASVYGKPATVAGVAARLAHLTEALAVEGGAGQAILGDLLLAHCLENRDRSPGQTEPIIRAHPAHYFASWIDLPVGIAHLRGAPELLVAMLAGQVGGTHLVPDGGGEFPVGVTANRNAILRLFADGVEQRDEGTGQSESLTSEQFIELVDLPIDQLLGARLGLSLEEAPRRLTGDARISNQYPLATRAGREFGQDLGAFITHYGASVPRQTLTALLESGMGIGFSATYFATFDALLKWERAGRVPDVSDQKPWPLFADCALGLDRQIRLAAEDSMGDLVRRLQRLPVLMMGLQILEAYLEIEWAGTARLPQAAPDPAARLNAFASALSGPDSRSEEISSLTAELHRKCRTLAAALDGFDFAGLGTSLGDKEIHPVWRLAATVVGMMGRNLQFQHYQTLLDACLMVNEPNGIGSRRRVRTSGISSQARSLVLSNAALDYLVHVHSLPHPGEPVRPLTLSRFLSILRDRYGFYVADPPPGMSIPQSVVFRNRAVLERRLRDMGLLRGVNDAEAMKRLRPRFEVTRIAHD